MDRHLNVNVTQHLPGVHKTASLLNEAVGGGGGTRKTQRKATASVLIIFFGA